MSAADHLAAMFAHPPVDWWRFVPCGACNARRQEPCQTVDGPARGPHSQRRAVAAVLHGTLWLLERHPGDVLGVPMTEEVGMDEREAVGHE